ncbi:MAG: hypothetical protein V3V20_06615 [Algisphaera sp.]
MPGTFECSVVTPEAEVYSGQVSYVVVPAHDGEMGFAVNRAPILVQVGAGTLRMTTESGAKKELEVSGGFAQMNAGKLVVLADSAKTDEA